MIVLFVGGKLALYDFSVVVVDTRPICFFPMFWWMFQGTLNSPTIEGHIVSLNPIEILK